MSTNTYEISNTTSSIPVGYALRRYSKEAKNRTALIEGATGKSLTYGELYTNVTHMAGWFRKNNIEFGDRVVCLSENSVEYLEMFLALTWIGAVIVPLNVRLNPKELNYIIDNAGAKAIFSSTFLIQNAANAIEGVSSVKLKIVNGESQDDWVSIKDVKNEQAAVTDFPEGLTGESLFMLLYTSGTTGNPKGCMIPHRSWNGYAVNMATCFNMSADDVYLAFLPFYHVAGLGTALSQLQLGGTIVTSATYEPADIYGFIEKYGISIIFLVPGISSMVLYHEDREKRDISSLRLFISGAGFEKLELVEDVERLLDVKYYGIYGQTESGSKITWADSEMLRRDSSTYGHVMPFFDFTIVDQNDSELGIGEVGELCVRGNTVMMGYWNMPQETRETLKNDWHHTGDLFMMNQEGLLKMVDRKKYLIKTGGENVYPQEVEQVLQRHDAIADTAVIGISDEKWGETVKAFVVLKPEQELSRGEIVAFVKEHIAGYKAPRYIEFVETIPRNVSGKILKGDLANKPTLPEYKV